MSDFIERIRLQQNKSQEDALTSAIRDGHIATGPHIQKLEQELKDRFSKKHAILTTNGFSALCATLLALKSSRGSLEVSTSAAGTCFAVVNAIKAAGYYPEFFDMDCQSAGLHRDAFIKSDSLIIAPDHFGRISSHLREPKGSRVFVIEDAAQSFFSREKTETFADVLTLSFYPTKWVNGIDGGAILLDDDALAHALMRQVSYVDQTHYESVGRNNFSMSNLHAAMVLASLESAPRLISVLNESFFRLHRHAAEIGVDVLPLDASEVPTRFIVKVDSLQTRDLHLRKLNKLGIGASKELSFLCPADQQRNFVGADIMTNCTYSLPFHPWLRLDELEKIEHAMAQVCD